MGRLWVDLSPTAIAWWKRVVNLTGLHIPVLGVRNRAVMLPGIQHIENQLLYEAPQWESGNSSITVSNLTVAEPLSYLMKWQTRRREWSSSCLVCHLTY